MSVIYKYSSIATLLAASAEARREPAKQLGIDIFDEVFIDIKGRQVLLHGVNMIVLDDPYIPSLEGAFDPEWSVTEQDLKNLNDWGINFVRLGAPWEAVEKFTGLYDTEYLEKLERLVNRLGQSGIHVMLDAHLTNLS
jgi:aryl-phospho-beta-D-glucosidase BglC (GH1 family)